jgi:hypothetical protein
MGQGLLRRIGAGLPAVILCALGASGCGDDAPAWCAGQGTSDASCAGPRCVAAVVIDYKRVEPRGYRIFALDGQPVDREAAEAAATGYLETVQKLSGPFDSDTTAAGDFFVSYINPKASDAWLVVTDAPSGTVVFGGLMESANPDHRGYDFPLPEGFLDASTLGCGDEAPEPSELRVVNSGIPLGTAPASTGNDAWEAARRLALTTAFTAGHSFRVMVVSYAPAENEFDPESADWYVWISRD